MFPAWPASGPESNASRTPAHSFSAPAGQNLPFTFSSRSCQSVNRQMLFLQLRFPRRENTRCIFFQHPKPSFPAWPANTSRCKSYYNLQQDNSFHSGASRPIPPATILFIPAPQSSTSQLPSSRLGRPTPYIPSHHFFNIYKVPSSHQVSLPTILQKSTNCHLPQHPPDASPPSLHHHSVIPLIFLFLFSILPSSSRLSPFRTSSSHHSPNVLHFFRPAAASCCRFSNPQAKRET